MPDELAAMPPAVQMERLQRYAQRSKANATWEAYRRDWGRFQDWCVERGLAALPAHPAVVADYAVHLGENGRSIRGIRRCMAAIAASHATAGHTPPTASDQVKLVLQGVAREFGVPAAKKSALDGRELRRVIEMCPGHTLAGRRDRAILAIGYFGAFRRSEVVALDRADVAETSGGLEVLLRRSKTDQEGSGTVKALKRRSDITDPATLLRVWLAASGITAGPLFRPIDRHGNMASERLTDHAVALILKRACQRAGLDPARYSGHSLRRGFATSAARGGADGLLIRRQTKHKSDRMVDEYVEEGTRFGRHAQDFIDTGP